MRSYERLENTVNQMFSFSFSFSFWTLFFMVSTLGHLILHIQPSPWWVFSSIFNVTWYYDKWHIQPSALNIKDYFIMVTLMLWLQFLASFVCLFCHPPVVSLEFGLLWPSIWVLGHLLASWGNIGFEGLLLLMFST